MLNILMYPHKPSVTRKDIADIVFILLAILSVTTTFLVFYYTSIPADIIGIIWVELVSIGVTIQETTRYILAISAVASLVFLFREYSE